MSLYVEQRIANEKKSEIVAYILWGFFGFFGVHRMYLGRFLSGFVMLSLLGVGTLLTVVLVGYIPLLILTVWWIFDVFMISAMIKDDVWKMRRRFQAEAEATNT